MTTKLLFVRDAAGYNTFGVASSDSKYDTLLLSGVEQTLNTPNGGANENFLAVIASSQGANVWVAINNTATVAGASFAATNSDLNPPALRVKTGDVLHFITGDTSAEVNVKFYSGIN